MSLGDGAFSVAERCWLKINAKERSSEGSEEILTTDCTDDTDGSKSFLLRAIPEIRGRSRFSSSLTSLLRSFALKKFSRGTNGKAD
jgi:hypothetical protein